MCGICALVIHQGQQIVVVDFFLAIGQGLEPHKYVLQLIVSQIITQIFQLSTQRSPARMFAHNDVGFGQADILWTHDFKGVRAL